MNRDHSVIFEIASKYCIPDSLVDYGGYSTSSKGFLPTVVDIMVIISHAIKVMLKILQARLQQYVNYDTPDVQAGFRKARGTRDQSANNIGSLKKQEISRTTSISDLFTMSNFCLCGS